MTPTEICNMALAYIAKPRIASINEETEIARQCKMFYDTTKRTLLREYTWGFAKRVDKLAELTQAYTSPYWKYIYAYPERCVAVRKIFDAESGRAILAGQQDEWDTYMVTSNVKGIGCNIPKAYLEYTYDVDDTELFSSDFLDAFSYMLAFKICLPLTGNSELQQTQYQLAQRALSQAKYTTVMERNQQPDYPSKYFDGRA